MKLESMVNLIEIYEAEEQSFEIQKLLTGNTYLCDVGVFSVFTKAFQVIQRECKQKLVNRAEDLDDREFYKILKSKELSSIEKAVLLLDTNK